jgi:hypothetical protein
MAARALSINTIMSPFRKFAPGATTPRLRADRQSFSAGSSANALIANLIDPFAGMGLGTTTYSTFGSLSDQIALSGNAIRSTATLSIAGERYQGGFVATSGDGTKQVGNVLSFSALADQQIALPPLVSPTAAWTGTASSGFAGSPPITTGTPVYASNGVGNMIGTVACSLNWLFTETFRPDAILDKDMLVLLDGGDMNDQLEVTLYVEGGSATLTDRVLVPISVHGGSRFTAAYGFRIRYADFPQNGEVEIYAKAHSPLPGVADRVIGPLRLYRKSGYDRVIKVGASQPVVAGVSYPDMLQALTYTASNTADRHIRVDFTEDTVVDVAATSYPNNNAQMTFASNSTFTANRRGNIDVNANGFNVRVAKSGGRFFSLRAYHNALNFIGVKWDFAGFNYANEAPSASLPNWRATFFIRCELYSSNGAQETPGDSFGNDANVRVNPFMSPFTAKIACYEHDLYDGGNQSFWIVGCRQERTGSDILFVNGTASNPSNVFYQNDVSDVDISYFRDKKPSMKLIYTGAGAATFSTTGVYNTNRVLRLYVDGQEAKSYPASATVGTGFYYVSQVVSDINATMAASGWQAILISDERRFMAIGGEGNSAAAVYTDVPCGNTEATAGVVGNAFGPHPDGVQPQSNADHDNHILMHNAYMNVYCQIFFFALQTIGRGSWNCVFRNNIGSLSFAGNNVGNALAFNSQIVGLHHHMMVDHNSIPNQQLGIRWDQGATGLDAYSSIRNNIFRYFDQAAASANAQEMAALVENNIVFNPIVLAGSQPRGANVKTNYILNALPMSSFPNLQVLNVREDFIPLLGSPARQLLPPVVKYDAIGRKRAATDWAGAYAA